jgi:predicted RNase H-like nuclease (RuvC/YqgF family)
MRKYFLALLYCTIISSVQAQKINVFSAEENIQKINRQGFKTTLNLSEKTVAQAWEDYLKDFGKVESSKGVYTMPAAKIKTLSEKPVHIISKIAEDKNGTTVFYAIDLGNAFVTQQTSQASQAQQFLQNFAMKAYQQEFGDELKSAEKELAIALKQQERKIQETESLLKEINRKKEEQQTLQKKLEDNKTDLEKLEKQVVSTKKDQTEFLSKVEKHKKAVEDIKQKFSSINE